MNKTHPTTLSIGLALVLLLAAIPFNAQGAAEPGATVRNAFGPQAGISANQCRGACGSGCPKTCAQSVSFECAGGQRLRRVVSYDCGTHEACRVHDNCLDACLKNSAGGACRSQCDRQVTERFGLESPVSWAQGKGPYDGRINFEYTLDAADALEPAYTCRDGASRQCGGSGSCVAANGTRVDPVFDAYPAAAANAMRISDFRSGPVCGNGVCEHATSIRVTGSDSCAGSDCTRFGMEFDYRNADPSAPLKCSTSTSGGDYDVVADLLMQGGDAMTSRNPDAAEQTEDDMAALMAMLGGAGGGPPPIPRTVDLPAASGHLFVPMYQKADGLKAGEVKERTIRCTHKGTPVLETTFRLQAG